MIQKIILLGFTVLTSSLPVLALALLFLPVRSAMQTTNPPGSLDTSFGSAGKVTTGFGPSNSCDDITAVAVQPDGKIVAAGYTWPTCSSGTLFTEDFALARSNPDGTLDQSFGTGGKLTTDFGNSSDKARALVLYPDGRILVAGSYLPQGGSGGIAMARYLSNGAPDNSFDSDGKLTLTGGSANAVTLYPGDKIVTAGAGIGANGTSDFGFTRHNMNGSLDTSFDTDGRVSVNIAGFSNDRAFAVTIQVDNKIVAAGSTNTGSAAGDFALVRLNEDGTLDTSFDTDGKVTTHFSDFDEAFSIIQYRTPNSIGPAHFVVAGYSRTGSSNSVFAIARYRNDGSLDPTFDFDGKVTTDFGQTGDVAYSVIVHPIGKIVVAGNAAVGTGGNFALARYGALGGLDTSFGTGGKVLTPFGGIDSAHAVALQADHKIIAAGTGGTFSNFDFALARYNNLAFFQAQVADFDGDGRTDVSVWRPSDGNWHISQSTAGYARYVWGASGDQIIPGDYDGDGKTDVAVWRPSTGGWFILNSGNGTFSQYTWGIATDVTVPGDYDNDGRTDVAVWRPSTGEWVILRSTGGSQTNIWGASGDVPLSGDFDGDGQTDLAVRRPSTGQWFINRSADGFVTITWGVSTDRPVHADYDGDQKDDVAVWRPSTGSWFILNSSGTFSMYTWGAAGDVPVPGDYDGDGNDDVAVYRNGMWHILQSTAGYRTASWGLGTDIAIPQK